MKKILIIGSGGSGKSTLARELGTILGTWNNFDTVGELIGRLTHQPQSILISGISVRFNVL